MEGAHFVFGYSAVGADGMWGLGEFNFTSANFTTGDTENEVVISTVGPCGQVEADPVVVCAAGRRVNIAGAVDFFLSPQNDLFASELRLVGGFALRLGVVVPVIASKSVAAGEALGRGALSTSAPSEDSAQCRTGCSCDCCTLGCGIPGRISLTTVRVVAQMQKAAAVDAVSEFVLSDHDVEKGQRHQKYE